jgi:hypothetical protein
MCKNDYPNPLRPPISLKGKLSKKRKYDSPPISKDQFSYLAFDCCPGVCQDEGEYHKKYSAWVDRQSDLDNEGFSFIADHYGLDRSDPDFYKHVALNLCRDSVPFFQMHPGTSSYRKGPQNSWTHITRQLLLIRVEIEMRKHSCSKNKATQKIAKKYKISNARKHLGDAEKIKDNKTFIKTLSLEDLIDFEKQLELYDRMAQLEYDMWLGKTSPATEEMYLKICSRLEKASLSLSPKK